MPDNPYAGPPREALPTAAGDAINPYQSPPAEGAAASELPEAFEPLGAEGQLRVRIQGLLEAGQNGAHWFYWIAAASVVNSTIMFFGGGIYFVVGLGVTLIVDAIAEGVASEDPAVYWIAKGLAFGFALVAAGFYCGIGWLSTRRWTSVHWIGMAIYLADALIFLAIGDFLSVAFHGWGLYHLFQGVRAYHELNRLERELAQAAADDFGDEFSA